MKQSIARKIFKGKVTELHRRNSESSPEILYISLHETCNENCVFCVVKGNNVGKFGKMNPIEVKATVGKFLRAGGKDIIFTGGEPTLRDDLPEIISSISGYRSLRSISIITNGVRLADASYRNGLLAASANNNLGFCFSLHSHRRSVSEKLTQSRGTFAKTIKGVDGVTNAGRRVSIYHVITSLNYKDLYGFARFIRKRWPDIKDVTLAYPFPQGNAEMNNWIYVDFGRLRPYLLKTLVFLDKLGYAVNIAACGQFPLCVIPGFEDIVVRPLLESEANITGVVGEKSFHEFEMASPEWIGQYKTGAQPCRHCLMRLYCQGFWKQYVSLFGFSGIQPVTSRNFIGNLVRGSADSRDGLGKLRSRIDARKMNLILLKSCSRRYLPLLLSSLKKNKILAVVRCGRKVVYPPYA